MSNIDGIMIKKGQSILCNQTLKVNGRKYFTEGNYYQSPANNCLVDDNGEEVFVQQYYLTFFILQV